MSTLVDFTVRPVTSDGAAILVQARRHMYEDMGETNAASLDAVDSLFAAWLAERLADGRVVGLVAEDADGRWLGALTVQCQEVQPSLGNPSGRQHYLFGLWVRPESRRGGVATALVNAAIERARSEGVGLISLMASDAGQPVYERMGFEHARAMRLFLDPLP